MTLRHQREKALLTSIRLIKMWPLQAAINRFKGRESKNTVLRIAKCENGGPYERELCLAAIASQ